MRPERSHSGTADGRIGYIRTTLRAHGRTARLTKESYRLAGPGGTIMHAELKIGNSMVMLGEATDAHKPMPAKIALYVEDTDAWYKRALTAGAKSLQEPADQFYGDRGAGVTDPAGNQWWIHTRIEDVSPEEIKKRAEAYMKQQQKK